MIFLRLALYIRSICLGLLFKRPLQIRSSTGQWIPIKRSRDWPETLGEAPASRLVGVQWGDDYWAVMFDQVKSNQGIKDTRMLILKGRYTLNRSGFNRTYQLIGMMSGPFYKYGNELFINMAVTLLGKYLHVDSKNSHIRIQVAVSEAWPFPLPREKQSRVLCRSHGHA